MVEQNDLARVTADAPQFAANANRIRHHRHHVRHQDDVEALVIERQPRTVGLHEPHRLFETELGNSLPRLQQHRR